MHKSAVECTHLVEKYLEFINKIINSNKACKIGNKGGKAYLLGKNKRTLSVRMFFFCYYLRKLIINAFQGVQIETENSAAHYDQTAEDN